MTEKIEKPAAEWLPTKDLVPWGRNPRRNDEAVQQVADSIRRFGFGSPIVARREDKRVIAGHTRLKAARLLGLKTVPVRLLDVNERDADLLALADNKLGEIAEWDEVALGEQLSEFGFKDLALAGWGWKELGELASDAAAGESAGSSAELDTSFSVVIECASEEEQTRVLQWCQEQELKCRALI